MTTLPFGVAPLKPSDPTSLGRYRLLGRIGAGGMGVVFLGEGSRGLAAVKMIRSEFGDDEAFRGRFLRELQACFRVSGTFTVRLLDFDVAADPPWLATEYVAAPNLEQLVARDGPLRNGAQLALALGLADALATLHADGITHRDLKPSNVLCPEGGVKVIDFGIAATEDAAGHTSTSQVLGSPAWMAPERLTGGRAVPAGDIFAWAGIVSFAACGHAPFGGDYGRLMYSIVHGEPAVDYEKVAPALRELVAAAFARQPSERPTAAELLTGIAGVAQPAAGQVADEFSRLLGGDWTRGEDLAVVGDAPTEADRIADEAEPAPPLRPEESQGGDAELAATMLRPSARPLEAEKTLAKREHLALEKTAKRPREDSSVPLGGSPRRPLAGPATAARKSRRRPLVMLVAAAVVLLGAGSGIAVALTSGGGSARAGSAPAANRSSSAASASKLSAPAAGSFGSLTKVCAPGNGTDGLGRGLSGKTIRVGVLADAGAAAAPGLGQEFFDAADAFAKWCNAAGGINGRQLIVDKLDAALFDGAQRISEACQRDFMLVGGANVLDSADVKPRLACNLSQIPAGSFSPEAANAGLQVRPTAGLPGLFPVGPLRLLAEADPTTQQALGIGSSTLSSIAINASAAQAAYQKLGYKVVALQSRPPTVDNYQSWFEKMKQAGASADFELASVNVAPMFDGMKGAGFQPDWVLLSPGEYAPSLVQAAASSSYLPNTYVGLDFLPFELAAKFPVVQQVKDMLSAAVASPRFDTNTILAFNAWMLWAQSATACGGVFTPQCVLQQAASHPAWDAGGLIAPVDTNPASYRPSDCTLLMRLTAAGWVYDSQATKPNRGVYNCDPKNLVTTPSNEPGA